MIGDGLGIFDYTMPFAGAVKCSCIVMVLIMCGVLVGGVGNLDRCTTCFSSGRNGELRAR